ncbi:MAG: hypothetical protein KDC03_23550, partial [Flavobacteriales bacterium]|nr:hypothetical protein [Flavobacteriales bacterium]
KDQAQSDCGLPTADLRTLDRWTAGPGLRTSKELATQAINEKAPGARTPRAYVALVPPNTRMKMNTS